MTPYHRHVAKVMRWVLKIIGTVALLTVMFHGMISDPNGIGAPPMNALSMIARSALRQSDAMVADDEMTHEDACRLGFELASRPPTTLTWHGIEHDGRDGKLTLDSEPWMGVYVRTRLGLAAAILRLACRGMEPTRHDVEAFLMDVVRWLNFTEGFTMPTHWPQRWLAERRTRERS